MSEYQSDEIYSVDRSEQEIRYNCAVLVLNKVTNVIDLNNNMASILKNIDRLAQYVISGEK